MNMAGNLGSLVTSLAFPYLLQWTGSTTPFFYVAAGLNGLAIALWMRMRPDRPLELETAP
jgi:ACS family glucarate transporter-like MFS transporter